MNPLADDLLQAVTLTLGILVGLCFVFMALVVLFVELKRPRSPKRGVDARSGCVPPVTTKPQARSGAGGGAHPAPRQHREGFH